MAEHLTERIGFHKGFLPFCRCNDLIQQFIILFQRCKIFFFSMTGNARFQTFPFYKRKCKRAFFFIQFAWADLYARIGVQMLQLSIVFIHMPDVEFSLFLQRKLPHTPDPILFCNPGHNLKFVPTFSRKFRIQNFPHTFTPFSPLQSERNWKKPETDRTSGFRQMLCLRQKV